MDGKQEKFERLAEKRVTEAIRILRLIGNLANKNNYSYTKAHSKQIVDAIENEIRQLKSRFKQEDVAESLEFTFDKKRVAEGDE